MRTLLRRLILFPLVLLVCVCSWPAYWIYTGSTSDTNEFLKEVLLDIWEGVR